MVLTDPYLCQRTDPNLSYFFSLCVTVLSYLCQRTAPDLSYFCHFVSLFILFVSKADPNLSYFCHFVSLFILFVSLCVTFYLICVKGLIPIYLIFVTLCHFLSYFCHFVSLFILFLSLFILFVSKG